MDSVLGDIGIPLRVDDSESEDTTVEGGEEVHGANSVRTQMALSAWLDEHLPIP